MFGDDNHGVVITQGRQMHMSDYTNPAKVKGRGQKAITSYCLVFAYYFLLFTLLLSAGCEQRQRVDDLYLDAVMLKKLDENRLAVEKLESVIRLDKDYPDAYSLLGEICWETKDYQKSAAFYEKATALKPGSFEDYFKLGQVYEVMGDLPRAVKAYVRASEINRGYLEAHISAAKGYYKLKDYNGALAYGRRAAQINPNVSEIQKLLGDVYELRGDHEQAICSYRRLLELDSSNQEVIISLAVAYLKTSRNEPARALLEEAIRMQPDNNIAHRHLGYCNLLLNDTDKAIQGYTRAVDINDKDWEAYRGLGVAYMKKAISDKDEILKAKAVRQWRMSLQINPNQDRREKLLELIKKHSE